MLVEGALAKEFGCKREEVEAKVDRLMRSVGYMGVQRQNPLGAGLIGATIAVLRRFGDSALEHEPEVDGAALFAGVSLVGRTKAPSIDIVTRRKGELVAITSCKWSVRHDRVGDITTECSAYKTAFKAETGKSLRYFVVTNEFEPARLTKMLEDECVDHVVHVHKPLVTETCRLDSRLEELWDLKDFLASSSSWV